MTVTLNAQAKQILDMMAASGNPTLDQLDPPVARQAARAGFQMLQGPKPDVAAVSDHSADGVPVRYYRPAGSDANALLPVLVYFHGGGWIVGDVELYDTPCRQLANASGCAVVSVDYRLAPEAKFPSAVEDAYRATQWVVANAAKLKIDAARLAVGGDSAGGNLAAVVSLLARDQNGPKIRFQLLIYPATDINGGTASYERNKKGYFLDEALMGYFINHYIRTDADKNDWRASPLLAPSHANLPPAHVLVCGFDPLCDDGLSYAAKLRAAGVAVTENNIADQIHGFLLMPGVIPAAVTAVNEMGVVLKKALS